MKYTVQDVLEAAADFIDGRGIDVTCATRKEQALRFYNRATRLMMKEDSFPGAWAEFCMPLSGKCLTLDRRLSNIHAAITEEGCCGLSVDIYSRYFKFLKGGFGLPCCDPGCAPSLTYLGDHFATHVDLAKAMRILCWSDRAETEGTKLTIQGSDSAGRELRSGAEPGWKIPILEGAVAAPAYTELVDPLVEGDVRHLTLLRKPRTKGYVFVYGYDPVTDEKVWLTTLAPDETSASRTRYELPKAPAKEVTVRVVGDLQYCPAHSLEEVALIQDEDAYIEMAKSIHAGDTGDRGGKRAHLNGALAQLKNIIRRNTKGQKHMLNVSVIGGPGSVRAPTSRRIY